MLLGYLEEAFKITRKEKDFVTNFTEDLPNYGRKSPAERDEGFHLPCIIKNKIVLHVYPLLASAYGSCFRVFIIVFELVITLRSGPPVPLQSFRFKTNNQSLWAQDVN